MVDYATRARVAFELRTRLGHTPFEAASRAAAVRFLPLASSRGEFHPPALSEPCVNLSIYTAPVIHPPVICPFASGKISLVGFLHTFQANLKILLYDTLNPCISLLPSRLMRDSLVQVRFSFPMAENIQSNLPIPLLQDSFPKLSVPEIYVWNLFGYLVSVT